MTLVWPVSIAHAVDQLVVDTFRNTGSGRVDVLEERELAENRLPARRRLSVAERDTLRGRRSRPASGMRIVVGLGRCAGRCESRWYRPKKNSLSRIHRAAEIAAELVTDDLGRRQ